MKQSVCKHCGSTSHYSFQCYSQRKPIKKKTIIEETIDVIRKIDVANIKLSRAKKKLSKDKTVAELTKLLDIVFAKWIKNRDKINDGTFKCISCGLFKSIKEAQCGHYYSRAYTMTRYHEDNCHLECETCNCLDDNHLVGYRFGILEKIGLERLKWLDDNYKAGRKFLRHELLELIEKYKL